MLPDSIQIYEGTGEWFRSFKKPIERSLLPSQCEKNRRYFIQIACIGYGSAAVSVRISCIMTDSIRID
jgi:hypothetical protein